MQPDAEHPAPLDGPPVEAPTGWRRRRVSFREDFRRSFFHGIGTLLPTILTLLIIVKGFEFLDYYIGRYIRAGIMYVAYHAIGQENIADLLGLRPETPGADLYARFLATYESRWYLALLSFAVAATLVYFVGFFAASVAGRAVARLLGGGIRRLPGIRAVYPYVKQVTDVFFATRDIRDFNRVVAVEYPRKGIFVIGLVVGSGLRAIKEATGEDYLCVFIPSAPTPVTGYTVLARASEIIDLPLTVEQALKFEISGGVIVPPDQVVILSKAQADRSQDAAAVRLLTTDARR